MFDYFCDFYEWIIKGMGVKDVNLIYKFLMWYLKLFVVLDVELGKINVIEYKIDIGSV